MTDLAHSFDIESPVRRVPTRRHRGTRRHSALEILAVGSLLYGGAALLNAEHLHDTAERQPYGTTRDIEMGATGALRWVSRTLQLDRPARALRGDVAAARSISSGTVEPERPVFTAVALASATPSPTSTSSVRSTSATPAPTQRTDRRVTTTPTTAMPATPATTAPAVLNAPTREHPMKLWVGGDSISQGIGLSLARFDSSSGVSKTAQRGQLSSGLTRPDVYDWARAVATTLDQPGGPPEVMVFIIGANDTQTMRTPTGNAEFGSDAWIAEYRTRVRAVMAETAGRTHMVWVGLPVASRSALEERLTIIDRIEREEAAAFPHVSFLDLRTRLSPDGGYQAYCDPGSGELMLCRANDGVHFTTSGYDLVARLVLERISALLPSG